MAEPNIVHQLSVKLVARVESLGLKGNKADDEAVAFLAGAATALEEADRQDLSKRVLYYLVMVVAVRGMMAVRETVARFQGAQP